MKQVTILCEPDQVDLAERVADELRASLGGGCPVVVLDMSDFVRFSGQVVVVVLDRDGNASADLAEILRELLDKADPDPVVVVTECDPDDIPEVVTAAGVEVVASLAGSTLAAAKRAAKHPAKTKAIAKAPSADDDCGRSLTPPAAANSLDDLRRAALSAQGLNWRDGQLA